MDDSMLCSLPDAECEICSHHGPAKLCQNFDRCQNARCLYCVNKFTADKFMRNMPRIVFVCETCTNAPAKRDAAPKPAVKAKEAARRPLPAATWSDDDLSDDESSDDEPLRHKQQRQQHARLKEKQKQRQAAPGKAAAEAARAAKRPAAGGEPKCQAEAGQGQQRSKKPKPDATAAGHGQVGSAEGQAARIASGQGASTSAPRPNSTTQDAVNRQPQQLPSQQLLAQKQLPDQQPQGQQQPQQPHEPEVDTDMQAAQRDEAQPRLQQQREQERQAAAAPPSLRPEHPKLAQQDVVMNGQQQHEQQQPDAMRPPDPGKAPLTAKATAIKRPAASGLPRAQAAGTSAAGTIAKKRPQEPAEPDLQASAAAAPAKKRKLPPIKPPTAAATERNAAAGPSAPSGAAAKPVAPARKPDPAAPRTKAALPKAGAAAGKASSVPGSNAAGLKAGAAGRAAAAAGGAAGKAGGATGAKAAAAGEALKRTYPVTTPTGPTARVPVVNDGIRRAAQQQAEAQRLEQQRREERERRAAEQKSKEALARRNPLQRVTSGMEAEKEKLHQKTTELEDDSDAECEEEQRKLANAMIAQAAATELPRAPSREEAPSPRRLWEGTLFALLDPQKLYGMEVPLAAFSVPGAPGSPTNVDNIRRLPTYLSTVIVPWRTFASKIPEGHVHKPVSSVAFHEKLSFSTSLNALQPVIRRLLDSKVVLFIRVNGQEWFFGLQRKSTAPMPDDRKDGDWPFGEVISHVEEHIVLLETMPDDTKQPWNAIARPTKSSLKGLGSGALADGVEPSTSGAAVGVAGGPGLAASYVGSFGIGMMSPEDTAEPHGLRPSSVDGAAAQALVAATAQKSAAATAPRRSDFMGSDDDDDMDLDQPQLDEQAGDHGQHGSDLAGLGDMGWDGDFDDVHSPVEADAMVQTGGTILHSHVPVGAALGMGHMSTQSGGAGGSGVGFGQRSGAQHLSSRALPSSAWSSRDGAPAPPPPPQLPLAQQRSTPASASSPFAAPQSPLPPLPSLPPPTAPPQQQQAATRFPSASMGTSSQFAASSGPSPPFNPPQFTAAPSASLGASEGDMGLSFDVGDMDPDVIRQLIAQVPGASGVAHNGLDAVVAHNSASAPATTMPSAVIGRVVPPLGPGPQDPRRLARTSAPGGPAQPRPHNGDGATRPASNATQPNGGHAIAANRPHSKSPPPRTGNGRTREHDSPRRQGSNQHNQRKDRSHSDNQRRHNGYSRSHGDSPPHRSSNGSKSQGGVHEHERHGRSPQHRSSDHSRRSGSSSLPPKQHRSSGSGLPASQHRSPAQRKDDHTKRRSSDDKGARTWKDRG